MMRWALGLAIILTAYTVLGQETHKSGGILIEGRVETPEALIIIPRQPLKQLITEDDIFQFDPIAAILNDILGKGLK
jgi:hypothetical protein